MISHRRGSAARFFSRRALLQGLGAAFVGVPLAGVKTARSQAAANAPRNLVLVTWPEGLEEPWMPLGGSGPLLLLTPLLAPFEKVKSKLLVVNGLTSGYNVFEGLFAHTFGPLSLWTGSQNRDGGLKALSDTPSIDQVLVERIGGETAFASLHFGVQTNLPSFISTPYVHFSGAQQPVPAEDDPNVMYDQIFGAALSQDTAAIERLRRRRGSVLDYVKAELRELQPQVAPSDRPKLEAHIAGIESVESNLAKLGMSCDASAPADVPTREAALLDQNFTTVTRLQTDLMVTAMQCGLTRVATLQLSNTDSQTKLPGAATTRGVHEAQHSGTLEDRVAVGAYFMQQLAYVLERLDAVVTAEGRTLLDDTLVVMGSEMGIGTHDPDPVPFFVAGGGGQYFKSGQYLKLPAMDQHTRLLLSVLHAMGLSDVTKIGSFSEGSAQKPLDEARL